MNLNLGCGSNKISGCTNVDVEESCKPDVVADFTRELPFPSDSAEKVFLFHVIEHVQETRHEALLSEVFRVLKHEGVLYISYPEFVKVAQNYIDNYKGMRDFWKATIYGRQLYPSDYHISLMDSRNFKTVLEGIGFVDIDVRPEPRESFNTVVSCKKGKKLLSYEELLNEEVFARR